MASSQASKVSKPTLASVLPTLVTKAAKPLASNCAAALEQHLSKESKALILTLLQTDVDILPTSKKRKK
jgi:hypothetical protein